MLVICIACNVVDGFALPFHGSHAGWFVLMIDVLISPECCMYVMQFSLLNVQKFMDQGMVRFEFQILACMCGFRVLYIVILVELSRNTFEIK